MNISEELNSEIIEEFHKNKDVEALINVLENTNNPSYGRFAIFALGDLKAEMAIEPLVHALLSNSYRGDAIKALGNIGNKKAVKPLFNLIRNHDEINYIREDILESLGKIRSTEAINIIIEMLLHEEISAKALDVLKKLGKLAVEPLITALDTGMKDTAIVALGEIGECAKAATQPLLKILETTSNEDDWDCSLRKPVLIALALIKDADAVEPLIKAINYNTLAGDGDYTFQNWIIFALGDIGDKRATKPLIQLMRQNSDNLIRGTTAAALGKIGDNQAIEPLLRILENERENSEFRDNAAWALLQLDGENTALPLLRYLKCNHKSIFDSLKGFQFPSEFKNKTSEG